MAIEIRRLALREGVKEEDFEKFMVEEIFPVIRTVIDSRMGMLAVQHTFLKMEPRRYWWIVDLNERPGVSARNEAEVQVQKVDQEWIETFPTDIGEQLIGQLDSYVTGTLNTPYSVLARASEKNLTTPSSAYFEGNQSGWFGSR
jgi:hypothetical protein